MTNEDFVKQIQNGINAKYCMGQLWQQNKAFVATIAKKYTGLENIDDLMQEGFIGLWKAADHYDPDAGQQFLTYAAYWVRQEMRRYIDNCSSMIRVPVHLKAKWDSLRKFSRSFVHEYGREPTGTEIRHFLNYSDKEYQTIEKSLSIAKIESTDDILPGTDDFTIVETIADPADHYEKLLDEIEQQELAYTIWGVVDTLPEVESRVIHAEYQNGFTLRQASEYLGMDYTEARKARSRAFTELRKPHHKSKLRPYLSERALSLAYGGGVNSFNRTWTSSTERAAFENLGC